MNAIPTSRLARRQVRHGRWSLAIAVALALNALLIGILAQSAPAIGGDPLPPERSLLASVQPPAEARPMLAVDHAANVHLAPAPATMPLPALPLPAIPAAALAPPSIDGWLTSVGNGNATGATAAMPVTGSAVGVGWDTPPRPEGAFDLERFYPLRQRRRGEGATVVVLLNVAADGEVSQLRVLSNDGHPAFAEASLRAVRALRWLPAEVAGKAVDGEVSQSIVWRVP